MLLDYADVHTSNADLKFGLNYLLDPDTASLKLHPAVPCTVQITDENDAHDKPQKKLKFVVAQQMSTEPPYGPLNPKPDYFGCNAGTSPGRGGKCSKVRETTELRDWRKEHPDQLSSEASWRRMKAFAQPTAMRGAVRVVVGGGEAEYQVAFALGSEASVGAIYDIIEMISCRDFQDHVFHRQVIWRMEDILLKASEMWALGVRYDSEEVILAVRAKAQHGSKPSCEGGKGLCVFCSAVASAAAFEVIVKRFLAEADISRVPQCKPILSKSARLPVQRGSLPPKLARSFPQQSMLPTQRVSLPLQQLHMSSSTSQTQRQRLSLQSQQARVPAFGRTFSQPIGMSSRQGHRPSQGVPMQSVWVDENDKENSGEVLNEEEDTENSY